MGGKALNGNKITNEEAQNLFQKIVQLNNLEDKSHKILLCGSARRGKKTCGDLDIVFIDNNGNFKSWLEKSFGTKKNGKPQTTALIEGVQVEFYEADHETWGSTTLMWTGSAYNNIKMRRAAKKLGLKMSQYGIKDDNGFNLTANMNEQEIYSFLGMEYLEPSNR